MRYGGNNCLIKVNKFTWTDGSVQSLVYLKKTNNLKFIYLRLGVGLHTVEAYSTCGRTSTVYAAVPMPACRVLMCSVLRNVMSCWHLQ